MTYDGQVVPEVHRATVAAALAETFPVGEVEGLEAGPTGASGAATFRVRSRSGDHLLRVEGDLIPDRNVHQYENLVAAAEAGIAPPVRFVDATAGVVVVQWIEARPLTGFPGGPEALTAAVGELIRRLQAIGPFPESGDWAEKVGRLLTHVRTAGVVAEGLLDDVAAAYDRVRAAWPRDPATFVPAHNDPNLSNILYDGRRLWLIDWETSSQNDPLVDLAVAANQLAPTAELRDVLLTAWRDGAAPDATLRARLRLAQFATTLFAGSAVALIAHGSGSAALTDLAAPSPATFERLVVTGELTMGAPETMATFAKVVLASLQASITQPDFDQALEAAAG